MDPQFFLKKLNIPARGHFRSRRSSRRPNGQRRLGTLLPRARDPSRRHDALRRLRRHRGWLVQHLLLRDRNRQTRSSCHHDRSGADSHWRDPDRWGAVFNHAISMCVNDQFIWNKVIRVQRSSFLTWTWSTNQSWASARAEVCTIEGNKMLNLSQCFENNLFKQLRSFFDISLAHNNYLCLFQ